MIARPPRDVCRRPKGIRPIVGICGSARRADPDENRRILGNVALEQRDRVDRLGRHAGGEGVRRGMCRSPSDRRVDRSEEHTSELQSLMRISYALLRLKKKKE